MRAQRAGPDGGDRALRTRTSGNGALRRTAGPPGHCLLYVPVVRCNEKGWEHHDRTQAGTKANGAAEQATNPRDFDTLIHVERLGKEAIAVPKVSLSGVWLGSICMIGNDRTLKTIGMGMGDLGAHLRPVADWYSNEGP